MAELTFKSSLSIDEVEDNFKDMDFFSEVRQPQILLPVNAVYLLWMYVAQENP